MLKFLIVIVCVFFLLRILSRMFIVSTFSSLHKKMQDQQQSQRDREGHITINKSTGNNRGKDDHNDEYVDYEEVK